MKNENDNHFIPDLVIGKTCTIAGKKLIAREADETGCAYCQLIKTCARFTAHSAKADYYKLCAGYYRDDCISIVFSKDILK